MSGKNRNKEGKRMHTVHFIGAGPGDPELITEKGKRMIEEADVIIYAGSLVNPRLLEHARPQAEIYNSAGMTLDEVIAVISTGARSGRRVVRLHTGDPSVYGAHREQMARLDELGIPYDVVPGVSSFLAAAASLKKEYTLPGASQTVILTRMEGRTPVPEGEQLEQLAAHRATMVIFLSVGEIETVCARLIAGGYPADTLAAVVYKASWPEERSVTGTLQNLPARVREAGITRTALVLVGNFLGDTFAPSKLYDASFSHGYRAARTTLPGVRLPNANKTPRVDSNSREAGNVHIIRSTCEVCADMGTEMGASQDLSARPPRLMIQGTMSNAGKSFLVAALCRIFHQDGLRAAPFKSQNMALNSFVTADGLEIGRAQAMQAEAAGIDVTVDMNPILLKPTGTMGSQVIVNGEVYGNMDAMEYYRRKPEFVPVIREAFSRLEQQFDVIVLEGAGSPAEINLRENDIVNMGMAKIADAPVLLVGDIDRGGVFASLYGTVELMTPEERARVCGLIINKFRGDVEILKPGLRMIEEKLHIPVIGVVPMEAIDLDDEDSLAQRLSSEENGAPCTEQSEAKAFLDIAVIRLPHISNFTDFNNLERQPGVSLRYVDRISRLGMPDLVILPGTKNTLADLRWLRECGLEAEILRLSAEKIPVIGICGGYQMLGETLYDPDGVEGEAGARERGLGLLAAETVFCKQKHRARVLGQLCSESRLFAGVAETALQGYEIHMGETRLLREGTAFAPILLESGRTDGLGPYDKKQADGQACAEGAEQANGLERADGLVFGTYLHGLFDNEALTHSLLSSLAAKKGIVLPQSDDQESSQAYRERQYDKLADLVRASLDMDAVYRIMREWRAENNA